ncbi:MAG: pht1 [Chloroflexi bacterium]|nr:pht1 [Chloroflexota bacterium]
MLSHEENELLTRVGPGTPMGEMLRRYWVPACLSDELPESDGDPIRVRLLGEDLVAFRDSTGHVGLMDEHCPHRGASLFFGRNEEGGLRCLYHGWKMDVAGNVLDMPCEPRAVGQDAPPLQRKVKHAAYPVVEQGDVVWAYLGPADKRPVFPRFQWTLVPRENRIVRKVVEECSWLQSLEGALDSPHFPVLHVGHDIMRYPDEQRHLRFTPPQQECHDTRYGFVHVIKRVTAQDTQHFDETKGWHTTARLFAVPFHSYVTGLPGDSWGVHLFVPMDDESNSYYEIRYHPNHQLGDDEPERHLTRGVDLDMSYRKVVRRLDNRYLQDRAKMRAKQHFSGIEGRPHEDMAMVEGMGKIYDRTKEHLGVADVVIIHLRERLLDSLRIFMAGGEPLGLDPRIPYDRMTMASKRLPVGASWTQLDAIVGDDEAVAAAARQTG